MSNYFKIRLADGEFWTESVGHVERPLVLHTFDAVVHEVEVFSAHSRQAQTAGHIDEAYTPDQCEVCVYDTATGNALGLFRYDNFLKVYGPPASNSDALQAIETHGGHHLQRIPVAERTAEVCRAAVSNFALALSDVPEELKTRELCLLAVGREDGQAYCAVPDVLKADSNICYTAANQSLKLLDIVDERFRDDPGTVSTALRMTASLLARFPKTMGPVVQMCVERYPQLIAHMNGQWDTPDMRTLAIQTKPSVIQDLREDQLSSALVWEAVQKDAHFVKMLPEWIQDDFLNARKPGLAEIYRDNQETDGPTLGMMLRAHVAHHSHFNPSQGQGLPAGHTLRPTHRIGPIPVKPGDEIAL